MKISILLTIIIGASMFFGAISIHQAYAAVDMFLKLDDPPVIQGESTDKVHHDEIDVLAWSWGMSNSGTTHVGGGAGAGKANFQDISITKYVDKSSPALMLHAANGDHIADGTLVVRKAGTTPLEYLVYEFKDILVTSVSTGGSGGEDRLTENISLNFAQIKVTYTEQTNTGGAGPTHIFNWNIPLNTAS